MAVTHVDGLVVARSGFHSSANYRSVVVHGRGRLLDGGEQSAALDVLVESLLPGRVEDLRAPSWAGVLPLSLLVDDPIPADDLRDGIPDYLRPYRR